MDKRVRRVGGLVLLAVVAGGALLVSPDWLLDRISWLAENPLRLGLALVVLALVRPLLAWPATLLAVVAGYGWGLVGFPAALALMAVTCTPPYLLARRSAEDGRFAEVGEKAVDVAGDFRSVVAGRLFPVPSDIVSIGAGLADVPPRTYLLATAIGQAPWAFAGVAAGRSVHRFVSEGIQAIASPSLIAAAVLVAVLLLVGPVVRHVAADDVDAADVLAR